MDHPSFWPDQFPSLALLAKSLASVLDKGATFSTTATRVKFNVIKVEFVVILDTGSSVNVISSRLARKIKDGTQSGPLCDYMGPPASPAFNWLVLILIFPFALESWG